MKTSATRKAIVATLLVAAAANLEAYFASPYPRKAVAPDESGGWIAINANAAPTARSPIRIAEGLSPSNQVGTAQDPNVHSASLASAPLSDVTVGFVSVVSR